MSSDTSSVAVPTMTNFSSTSPGTVQSVLPSKEKIKEFFKQENVTNALLCAILVGITLFILNHKSTYRFTNDLLGKIFGNTFDTEKECPTDRGVLIHSIVGAILVGLFVYFTYSSIMKHIGSL